MVRSVASALLTPALALLTAGLSACAPYIKPVPVGQVPRQATLQDEDQRFGREVLRLLTRQYDINRQAAPNDRVERVAGHLASALGGTANPWQTYVLDGDSVKNAAATRGNYIFVWTGILRATKSDGELAAILAHEMAHVLAGHTQPTPLEEANQTLSGIAGSVASTAIMQTGAVAPVAGLAGSVATEAMKALFVNPELQRKELEADQIGLFLMADAGYDPEEAVRFWERAQKDPDFSGSTWQVLSSHPSAQARLDSLRSLLDRAKDRFAVRQARLPAGLEKKPLPFTTTNSSTRANTATGKSEWDWSGTPNVSSDSASSTEEPATSDHDLPDDPEVFDQDSVWVVTVPRCTVFDEPDRLSPSLVDLRQGTSVVVKAGGSILTRQGEWFEIRNPVSGLVRKSDLKIQME